MPTHRLRLSTSEHDSIQGSSYRSATGGRCITINDTNSHDGSACRWLACERAIGLTTKVRLEWTIFEKVKLAPEKIIIPGVIDTKTNVLEHPELVAQRIERYARLVGRERMIAGTDCGFGTFVGFGAVHPKVAWLKLDSLVQGARLASKHLWS